MPTHPVATAIQPWRTTHPLTPEDKAGMAGMRAMVEPNKGKMQGIAGRGPFDAIMMRIAQPEGVSYRQETIGACRAGGASRRRHSRVRRSFTCMVAGSTGPELTN